LIAAKKHELPKVKNAAWVRNDIDRFVLARLEHEGMAPSPEADRRTLIRRLSFDLVGLPPTPDEVDAFLADNGRDAYEKVVDRLLGSKHFGERMAVHWLDVVRYADTAGYHSDNHRDVYLYRDWVIDAFNNNMPFRDFAVAQIAGDMMPNPTNDQKIASGHNRLLQTTEEGGGQAKEYTAKYAADRVRNFSVAWLGLTLGCTECHDLELIDSRSASRLSRRATRRTAKHRTRRGDLSGCQQRRERLTACRTDAYTSLPVAH